MLSVPPMPKLARKGEPHLVRHRAISSGENWRVAQQDGWVVQVFEAHGRAHHGKATIGFASTSERVRAVW
jgi:hypothetical protein